MAQNIAAEVLSRIEALRKAGKSAEADKIEKRLSELLSEANNIPTDLVIEVDMGPPPFVRNFADSGFHIEHPRLSGKIRFEVKPIIRDGESSIRNNEMLKRAREAGCDMDQQQGDCVAAYLNSPAGKTASKAIRDSGCSYIVLPNEKGFWVYGSRGLRYAPILLWYGKRWVSDLVCLGLGYGSRGRFLAPCK